MEIIGKFLQDKNIRPNISFKDGQSHIVTFINAKIDQVSNDKGEVIDGIRFLVKENNQEATFFTASIGLLQQLKDVSIGETVKIQMLKRKTAQGFRSYFVVEQIQTDVVDKTDAWNIPQKPDAWNIPQENIPVIENGNNPPISSKTSTSTSSSVEDTQS